MNVPLGHRSSLNARSRAAPAVVARRWHRVCHSPGSATNCADRASAAGQRLLGQHALGGRPAARPGSTRNLRRRARAWSSAVEPSSRLSPTRRAAGAIGTWSSVEHRAAAALLGQPPQVERQPVADVDAGVQRITVLASQSASPTRGSKSK